MAEYGDYPERDIQHLAHFPPPTLPLVSGTIVLYRGKKLTMVHTMVLRWSVTTVPFYNTMVQFYNTVVHVYCVCTVKWAMVQQVKSA